MSEPFDAYLKWLSIPGDEQPPDHYRLLGVRFHETDLVAIETAANQRRLLVESHLNGPHRNYAIFVLKEIQGARDVLLNPTLKANYDASLLQIPVARLAPTIPNPATNSAVVPPAPPVSPINQSPSVSSAGDPIPASIRPAPPVPPQSDIAPQTAGANQIPLMPPAAGVEPMPVAAPGPQQIPIPPSQASAFQVNPGSGIQALPQVQQSDRATPVQPRPISPTSLNSIRPQKRKDQSTRRALILAASVIGGGLSAVILVALLKPFIIPANSDQQVIVEKQRPALEVESDEARRQFQRKTRRLVEKKRQDQLEISAADRKQQEEARIVYEQYLKDKHERELAELENKGKPVTLLQPLEGNIGMRLLIRDSDSMVGSTRTNTQLVSNSSTFRAIGLTHPGTTISAAINDNVFDHATTVADAQGNFEIEFGLDQGMNNVLLKIEKSGNRALTIRVQVYRLTGPVIRITTTAGQFTIELFADDAPNSVANFRRYLDRYHHSIIHRSAHGANRSDYIVQGGLYRFEDGVLSIIRRDTPVANEFKPEKSNLRGTIAWVHPADDKDGATSQWQINMANNSVLLDAKAYTVFGRVVGSMLALEKIHGSQEVDLSSMGLADAEEFPLLNFSQQQIESGRKPQPEDFYTLTFIEEVGRDQYSGQQINFVLN